MNFVYFGDDQSDFDDVKSALVDRNSRVRGNFHSEWGEFVSENDKEDQAVDLAMIDFSSIPLAQAEDFGKHFQSLQKKSPLVLLVSENDIFTWLEYIEDLSFDVHIKGRNTAVDILKTLSATKMKKKLIDQNERLRKDALMEQKWSTLGKYLSEVSHEMKNSLHIFMAQLDILKRYSSAEETDPAKINKVVDGMGKTLDQMVGLTGAVGRFSSGAKTSSENCCDVISVVTNCMKIYEARMKKLGINKTVKIPEVHLSGMISEFELTQVIFNLLENAAFKAKMIRGLEISLELKFDDQFARVIIEDNGDPIPKDIRDKIFTPYFTTKGSDGSGQGLYICRKKLQDNGGDITLLHSAETTAFEVKIPLL